MDGLLLIGPDVQEEVLFLEFGPGGQPVCEHDLRGLPALTWAEQRDRWNALTFRAGIPAEVS
jgi:hypothetical protein